MTRGGAGTGFGQRLPLREALGYAAIAGAVWLGWEVVKVPVVDRAPPALAVRLAGGSPSVLRRAAEAELLARRYDNAGALAAASLSRAPFNAAALRVRGLVEADRGSEDRADEMLTLAGNWSLRDDPAHAWLVERRLRKGDYASAFAHADTLARRRPDLSPSLFNLFTAAAVRDPRAFPVVTRLLAADPPWRSAFLAHLHQQPSAAPVLGGLAVALEQTEKPFTRLELERLYDAWLVAGRLEGIRQLRVRLNRPPAEILLQNGGFSQDLEDQLLPFGWRLGSGAGKAPMVVEDDVRAGNPALRIQYDGFAAGPLVEQTLMLAPGPYVLRGSWRAETPPSDIRMTWKVICLESGDQLAPSATARFDGLEADWRPFSVRVEVPQQQCGVQVLRVAGEPGDRRTTIAVWIDDLQIDAAGPGTSAGSPRARGQAPGSTNG